jgi:hypothetical protein
MPKHGQVHTDAQLGEGAAGHRTLSNSFLNSSAKTTVELLASDIQCMCIWRLSQHDETKPISIFVLSFPFSHLYSVKYCFARWKGKSEHLLSFNQDMVGALVELERVPFQVGNVYDSSRET